MILPGQIMTTQPYSTALKMINDHKILAMIPARGGSKGVPRKNIRILGNKPLIAWTIEAAKKSKYIDRLILSSEDAEIIEVAKAHGCEVPFVRDISLAQDDTPGINVVLDAVNRCPGYTHILLLQPTSPFRTYEHIDFCIEDFFNNKYKCSVSVTTTSKHPFWTFGINQKKHLIPLFDSLIPANRQELPPTYTLNGAIYFCDIQWLKKNKTFITHETSAFYMEPEKSIDIDSEFDFKICHLLAQKI